MFFTCPVYIERAWKLRKFAIAILVLVNRRYILRTILSDHGSCEDVASLYLQSMNRSAEISILFPIINQYDVLFQISVTIILQTSFLIRLLV